MYLLYNLALTGYFLAVLPFVVYRRLRHRTAFGRIGDRLGRLASSVNPDHQRSIWVHAVSVGEVLAVSSLVAELRATYPAHRIVVSTTTATGQRVAERLSDVVDAIFYAPLDFPSFVRRALDRVAPDLLVLVDTEIWPTLLRACRRRGVKTALVNGRLSDRSFRRYRLVAWFMRRVWQDLDRVCAQNEAGAERFRSLGVPADRVTVTGSLKFDAVAVAASRADLHVGDRVLRAFQFASGRPVLIAASTLHGEEEPILRAFARCRTTAQEALLILAPRHPERFAEARQRAIDAGFEVAMRSALPPEGGPTAPVIVLDSIGELSRLFQCATVVFVGGSLVDAGGHNILEPAAFGKAIVFGPYMDNFAEIADMFVARGAAWQARSTRELEDAVVHLMADPVKRASLGAAALALLEANRGAQPRSLAILAELVPPGAGRPDRRVGALRAVQ